MKILMQTSVLVMLTISGRATADIDYGPYTFDDNAFADSATDLKGGLLHVFPELPALCEPGSVNVLTGFSPECCLINIGTMEPPPAKSPNSNYFQLDFTNNPAVNGPGADIIFFDAQFSADNYEFAVRVIDQPFGAFLPFDMSEFVNLGLPGPSDTENQSVMYALEINLDTFGIAPNAIVDAIQFKALSAKAGIEPQGDPVMAAVMPAMKGPPNNICDKAIEIGLGDTAFSTIGAYTMGPPHPECLDNGDDQVGSDIWFKWTAPCSGNLTASTCGEADFNTRIAVYENCSCDLDELALIQIRDCNDDAPGCGTQSEVTTFVFPGVCYLIRVGGFEGAQGSGTLTLSFEGFFDDCESAEILDGVEGILNVCTTDYNTDGPPHEDCGGQIHADRWYNYIAQCSGELTVSTCNLVDFDSIIAIYDGCGCPVDDENLLACSDDEPGCGSGSLVSIPIVTGNCYKIRIGGANGADGEGHIQFSCAVTDECPWDLNTDGYVGTGDLLALFSQWGTDGPADFDGNGVVGTGDLLILFSNWGLCK